MAPAQSDPFRTFEYLPRPCRLAKPLAKSNICSDYPYPFLWVHKGVRFIDGEPEFCLEILELRQRQALAHTPNSKEAPAQATR